MFLCSNNINKLLFDNDSPVMGVGNTLKGIIFSIWNNSYSLELKLAFKHVLRGSACAFRNSNLVPSVLGVFESVSHDLSSNSLARKLGIYCQHKYVQHGTEFVGHDFKEEFFSFALI